MSEKLATIAMTPRPELGYDPIPAILAGKKTHTLRKRRVRLAKRFREVTLGRKRMGIILEFRGSEEMNREQFLTDEFAQADGLRDAAALREAHEDFYGEVPETMWCNHFRLVEGMAGAGEDVSSGGAGLPSGPPPSGDAESEEQAGE